MSDLPDFDLYAKLEVPPEASPEAIRKSWKRLLKLYHPDFGRTDPGQRRANAEANGATFVDLGGLVCSYDPCPVVIGNVLVWRDESHMTATFARLLAPTFAALLKEAAAP